MRNTVLRRGRQFNRETCTRTKWAVRWNVGPSKVHLLRERFDKVHNKIERTAERRRRWGLVTTTCNNVVPSTISRREQETRRRWNKVPEMAAATFSRPRVLKTNDALYGGTRWKNANLCPRDPPSWRTALTRIKDGWVPAKPRFPFFLYQRSYRSFRRERHQYFFHFFFSHDNAVEDRDILAGCYEDKSQRIVLKYPFHMEYSWMVRFFLEFMFRSSRPSSRDSPFPKHPSRADLHRYFHRPLKMISGRGSFVSHRFPQMLGYLEKVAKTIELTVGL